MITARLDEKQYMLDLALYRVKKELAEIGEYKVARAHHDYRCKEDKEERLELLCSLLPLLEDELSITALDGGCLEIEEAECFTSKYVVLFEEGARADLEIDSSGLNLWVALNPDSVPRQKWEEASCDVACTYELVLDVNHTDCTFVLESKAETLDCEVIDEFVAAHKSCAYDMKGLSFQEQCAYEFDILLRDKDCEIGFETYRKTNGCELDLEHYVCLRNCDLDQTIIRTVLSAGCTINVAELS